MRKADPSGAPTRSRVTMLLERLGDGDARALDRLMPLVHDELRRIARRTVKRERALARAWLRAELGR
jgi:hypothetical protein